MDTRPVAAPSPTDRVDADEAELFRALFHAYPDAMLLVDRDGTIVRANPSAAVLFGYGSDELIGLNVDALVPDAIRGRHAAHRRTYGSAPRVRPMGTQISLVARCKDGSETPVEIALSPLLGVPGPLVVAAVRAIGDYPRVRQALKQARYSEQLARLGELAVDARDPQVIVGRVPAMAAAALEVDIARVFLIDADGTTLRVASGVGEVPGETVGTRVPYRPKVSPGMVLAKGQPLVVADYRRERRFVVPQAFLDAGLTSALAVPVSDRGRTIGVLVVRSRAARQFGDDELRFLQSTASLLATSLQRAQSEEALNHAQRLESVGQLTGGIAHDFNNLLTVIQGNLQVLDELPPDADNAYRRQLLAAATRASRRGAELTAKLLAFSRRQVLQPTEVDAGALVRSLADMLRRTLDQHIEIHVEIEGPCPKALADPAQLESALLNIAINSRDAMPEGGVLRFHVSFCCSLPADVRARVDDLLAPDDGFIAISIGDNGCGMPNDVKEHAFEPFFTTKEVGRGTGLGLSTVYGYVRQSRGALDLVSSPGAGTTLTLYIPQAPADIVVPAVASCADGEIPAGLDVILVEDDAEVREVTRTSLLALGCRVRTAPNAEDALSMLDAAVELIVTDIALGPGLRGTQLAALAQQRWPGRAILLMSGFSAELLDADRDSPPDWELLQKPCSREALAAAMARALRLPGRRG